MNNSNHTPEICGTLTAGDPTRFCGESIYRVGLYDMGGDRRAGEIVASSHEEARANAAFIVRACNSHESLVVALERMLAEYGFDNGSIHSARYQARAALQLAKGEASHE